jgi:hypothetical protein
MSRPEMRKISIRAVERRRLELDSQRALLHRTLRDARSIEDAMDVFRELQLTLHPPRKKQRLPGSPSCIPCTP